MGFEFLSHATKSPENMHIYSWETKPGRIPIKTLAETVSNPGGLRLIFIYAYLYFLIHLPLVHTSFALTILSKLGERLSYVLCVIYNNYT